MLGYGQHFLDLFYPRLCLACNKNLFAHEHDLCWTCLHKLPRTGFADMPNNPLEQLFWGRFQPTAVTSFLFFNKSGLAQHMLHQLKYGGAQNLGIKLGRLMGDEFKNSHRFRLIDMVVPVPLHPKKERLRGYNQSSLLAFGVADEMHCELNETVLSRKLFTETQTKKGRLDRWENVQMAFESNPKQDIRGKKILLIDDVLTTGATLEACASLLQSAGASILMATVACALR